MGVGGPQRPNARISFGGGGGGPMMRGTVPPPGGFFITTTGPAGNVDMLPMLHTLFGAGSPFPLPTPTGQGQRQGARPLPQPPNMMQHLWLNLLGVPLGDHDGQFGDYAVTNEGLDRIITQLMEQTNGDKPVPAPDDMIARLPRFRVAANSPMLQQDCAVCKDEFEVSQETIELPCEHVFHNECILPWIKQSGTCPVCRYELVPQPKHAPASTSGGGSGLGTGNGSASQTGAPGGGGRFALRRSSTNNSDNNGSASRSQSSGGRRGVPGGWADLD